MMHRTRADLLEALPASSKLRPCDACRDAKPGSVCGSCRGSGFLDRRDPKPAPDALEFLAGWTFVRQHGLAAWLSVYGDPDPRFLAAMQLFDATLARLEAAVQAMVRKHAERHKT